MPQAAGAQTTQSAAAQTTGARKVPRGAIYVPEEPPTTGTTRMAPKTEIELRQELKKALKEKDLPTYDPDPRERPPGLPGATDSSTTVSASEEEVSTEAVVAPVGPPIGGNAFTEPGPGPIDGGQSENVSPSNRTIGAAHAIACHPTDPNTVYVGFVNGGVWKTTNAYASAPVWSAQTDALGSLSIGDVGFDPTDSSHQTLVAGIGRFSSLAQFGGNRAGLLHTTDGGANWRLINGSGSMIGKNISGVAARGATIVASVSAADANTLSHFGIFRSTDGGASFSQVPTANGLPQGRADDLAGVQGDPAVLYTSIRASSSNGIYKSNNAGFSWTRVSDATMDTFINSSTSNVHIAAGTANNVYAAIANNNRLAAVFRSGDGGTSWLRMDLPQTNEGGVLEGIHVGGQAYIHFSLVADPANPSIVYIGGDRQPTNINGGFPNSIGARNFSGRLFRGDASLPTGSQWKHLTHSNTLGAPGGGTASNSAPHADSRDMAFDASGNIVQGDDGGVFRRTAPQSNTGNWFSMQGTLRTTEIHDLAYDNISNTIVIGSQDNGTAAQRAAGTWNTISSGDGGDVAVDDLSLASTNRSVRYTSFQNLGGLRRRIYNSLGTQDSEAGCPLTVVSGPAIAPKFYTPVKVNPVAPTRLVIGAKNGLYESLDSGNTVSMIGLGLMVGADELSGSGVAVGGRKDGIINPDVIYAVDGAVVSVRTSRARGFNETTITATGGNVLRDVTIDPNNYATAATNDQNQVFLSTNTGGTWSDITGDLTGVGLIRCILFVPTSAGGAVCVGTQNGVYVTQMSDPGQWSRVGTNMPTAAYVFDLDYDETDDVLVAGTLGRSAFRIANASRVIAGSAVGEWEAY